LTLIVALPAQDGVVFASDSQVTTGFVRSSSTKIFKLNDRALWGGSGELAVIQRVAERIESQSNRSDRLVVLRDQLAQAIKDTIQQMLTLDFRTQFVATDSDALLSLHPADFLFVEWQDEPRVLHVLSNGTAEWIDGGRFSTTGNGNMFAHALLQKYEGMPLGMETAKLLAYKVISEVIAVQAYGLGPPIDIWEASKNGIMQASQEELAALADTANLLRKREVEMLLGESAP
jgi:20S proteasome alpha/beta subunit